MLQPSTVPVRLTDHERQLICEAVEKVSLELGFQWDEISLFGSRTKLDQRGGDIDLYLRVAKTDNLQSFAIKQKLLLALHELIGEQKIDIVVDNSRDDLGAFGKIIDETKVVLWTKK